MPDSGYPSGGRYRNRKDDSVDLRMRYAEEDLDRLDVWLDGFKASVEERFKEIADGLNDRIEKLEVQLNSVKSRASAALATMAASAVLLAINILVERSGGG